MSKPALEILNEMEDGAVRVVFQAWSQKDVTAWLEDRPSPIQLRKDSRGVWGAPAGIEEHAREEEYGH